MGGSLGYRDIEFSGSNRPPPPTPLFSDLRRRCHRPAQHSLPISAHLPTSFLASLSSSFIRSIPLLSSSRSLLALVHHRSLYRRRGTRGRRRSHSSAASSLAGIELWRGSQRVERRRQRRGAQSSPFILHFQSSNGVSASMAPKWCCHLMIGNNQLVRQLAS
ncbi:uncharacterized protein DS421_16g547870 [Arachis hypogaea]|nr:uncharacterized protein DS421_16g547870 [Arachis hypogaea]